MVVSYLAHSHLHTSPIDTSPIHTFAQVRSARQQLRKAACPVPLGANVSPIRGALPILNF